MGILARGGLVRSTKESRPSWEWHASRATRTDAVRQLAAHSIYYFVPGILKHFDSEGIMALLAPRLFWLSRAIATLARRSRIKKLEEILTPLYQLTANRSFRSVIYPTRGMLLTTI